MLNDDYAPWCSMLDSIPYVRDNLQGSDFILNELLHGGVYFANTTHYVEMFIT